MGNWILNYDAAPFCNSSLHLGHVRNYVLGDVRARWLRKKGLSCSYRTSFDAFGQPNEVGARNAGLRATDYVAASAEFIRAQMESLRLSYSAPIFSTCDPDYYRWTQWLFLRMWAEGMVYRQQRAVPFCRTCESTLASSQTTEERCWRCDSDLDTIDIEAWYVETSKYSAELYKTIDTLTRWSDRGRNLLSEGTRAYLPVDSQVAGSTDWLVSRSLNWGTPLPAVTCEQCGVSPVSEEDLPVRHREHGGDGFARCATCAERAPLVGETLDCFFDDSWSFFGGARNWVPGPINPFEEWRSDPPSEVHFHAGFDTYTYLPLYRFVARFLFEHGYTPRSEPVNFYHGHDIITRDGKKMSKRWGNAPDLNELLNQYGTDVVRLSVLVNANPDRSMDWSNERLEHAKTFASVCERLRREVDLYSGSACASQSKLTETDQNRLDAINEPHIVDRFIDEYRMAAALDTLYTETRLLLRQHENGDAPDFPARGRRLHSWWELFVPQTESIQPVRDEGNTNEYRLRPSTTRFER